MVSDGLHARVGTLTAGKEWFKPWKTMDNQEPGAANLPELQVMLEGVCEQSNFLNILRDFIVFDDDGSGNSSRRWLGITSSTPSRPPWKRPSGPQNSRRRLPE